MQPTRHVFVGAVLLVLLGMAVPAVAQQDDDTIVITALHAIPGDNDFPADIYLNGELAIEGFTMMMRTDPFELPLGTFSIAIYPAGADPATTTPAIEDTIDIGQPGNYSLVAQLAATGQPIIAVYANDLTPLAMGQGRLVVRQTSDIEALDVLVGDEVIAAALPNTGEVTVDVPAGVHSLQIVPAGGGDPLAASEIELVEGELTVVFIIATLTDDAVDFALQTVAGLQSTPSAVPTGSGGLAADRSPLPAIGLLLAGALALATAVAIRARN